MTYTIEIIGEFVNYTHGEYVSWAYAKQVAKADSQAPNVLAAIVWKSDGKELCRFHYGIER
jgi:hypothetical protein